ncbi:MAG: TetR family transcriptional regulator [Oscillospiraceae bacterium]|nr:TetR family transcriptional regulator [Oscillospiraceae bacterium]
MTANKQYYRTHRAIQSAFLTLLSRKPFEKITVQDILDNTPVSRATFYKHFKDKYEIAEKIQEEILDARKELRENLSQVHPGDLSVLVERYATRYMDMGRLLLHVRTNQVDLPLALDLGSREHYLSNSESPTRELEARIYGAAVSAMLVAILEDSHQFPVEQMPMIMLPVVLHLLGLPDDPDVTRVIREKYSRKYG